jgi:hypothetical protein
MVSRWAYEALAVDQFVNNDYQKIFYKYDREIHLSNYKKNYYVPQLEKQLGIAFNNIRDSSNAEKVGRVERSLLILRYEIGRELKIIGENNYPEYPQITRTYFDSTTYHTGQKFLFDLKQYYTYRANKYLNQRNEVSTELSKQPNGNEKLEALRNANQNDRMKDMVENIQLTKTKIQALDDRLIQKVYPIYSKPNPAKWINVQSKFYAPEKALFGQIISTYWVNVLIIWLMTISSMIILYFDVLKKIVDRVGEFRENRIRKKEQKEE